MVFLSYNPNKWIIGKSPKINIKHIYDIIYVTNMWKYVPINYKIHVCILHASSVKNQNRHTRAKGVKEVTATTSAMQETAACVPHSAHVQPPSGWPGLWPRKARLS
jgi:hypothetical protein